MSKLWYLYKSENKSSMELEFQGIFDDLEKAWLHFKEGMILCTVELNKLYGDEILGLPAYFNDKGNIQVFKDNRWEDI